MYSYVITGNGYKALPVKSELGFSELEKLIRMQSRSVGPGSTEMVWNWGVIEFINPKVHILQDYANTAPALM